MITSKRFTMSPRPRKLLVLEVDGGTRLFTEDGYEFKGVLHMRAGYGAYGGVVMIEMADFEFERVTEPPNAWALRDATVKATADKLARELCVTTAAPYQHIYDAARRILDMQMPRPQSGPLTPADLEV